MKTISISLSPNTEKDDISLALSLIFKPWKWKRGKEIKDLERMFRNYFGFKNAFSFNSGRSSLISILKAMEIGNGDEVIIQAFTCNAAVNPIIYVGATPIFADINESLNISAEDVIKKITSKTKAVMIQHTFGYPADIDEIRKICVVNNLYLIEDCAHALGAKYKDSFCGSFGDASFFSFGRDKIISSVYGGMVTVNNEALLEKVSHFQKEISYPSLFWIKQQLLHPVLMNKIVLPLYNSKIGRGFLAALLNLNILSKAVTSKENQGKLPSYFPERMPNALAILAINQFKKLDRFNEHRREIAQVYNSLLVNKKEFKVVFKKDKDKEAIFLKYPILNVNPLKVAREARKKGIYLNDGWFGSVVVPPLTSLNDVCYIVGSCPQAEEIAKRIVCLPTHINISRDDARRVFDCL
ncbi:MAG TPA: DegT/DnrJ/EryC1/StrS family aminotransferase [Candidatus Pacearchaeota archaeon]|nr:DegT/DnrJ/EryC1/StrS family aminotransferase [Candidatus Pacearchaeota archaeon]HPR80231.1 DegT/DnrJ/EryC1/StrS family aminotransferase [Candidatus Pacearchaeota archaeon]